MSKTLINLIIFVLVPLQAAFAQEWKEINPWIQYAETEKLLFFKITGNKYKPTLLYKKDKAKFQSFTISDIAKTTDAELIINANFFDPDEQPLGLIKQDNLRINKLHKGGNVLTGLFQYDGSEYAIVARDNYTDKAPFALQAGPRLIVNANATRVKYPKRTYMRSGLCLDSKNDVIVFVTQTGETLSFLELQETLIKPPISCFNSLNLDGGGSSQLLARIQGTDGTIAFSTEITGFSYVPTFLAFSPAK